MSMLFLAVIIPCLLCLQAEALPASPIVKTHSGQMKGHLIQLDTSKQGQIYEFLGIPFAEPPTGPLRYKKTVPVKPWESSKVLDATTVRQACIQQAGGPTLEFALQSPILGSEDCLYVNIWAPKWAVDAVVNDNAAPMLNTVIFMHGGGFWGGSGSYYNGTVLAGYNDIIVAEIQYRLGSLGFAYYGTEDMPGNMGLWDQLEAFKWVYENIDAFGGYKNAITIAGQSAGAASVTFHLQSPKSRAYFQRGIVQSAASTAPWATHTPKQATTATDAMLKDILSRGLCHDTSMSSPVADKIKCLMSVNATIFPRADTIGAMEIEIAMAFVPVIDGDFVPLDSTKMLRSGDYTKVPLLIGVTKDEGSLFTCMSPKSFEILPSILPWHENRTFDVLNMTVFETLLEDSFRMFVAGLWEGLSPVIMEAIRLQYWPQNHHGPVGDPPGEAIAISSGDVIGDNSFLCPTYDWAAENTKFTKDIYAYFFTHRPASDTFHPDWMGAVHGVELEYTFGFPFLQMEDDFPYDKEESDFSLLMMSYWANFIKYGDPNKGDGGVAGKHGIKLPRWPTHAGAECRSKTFFDLNPKLLKNPTTKESVICGLKTGDCEFWLDYFPKLLSLTQHQNDPCPSTTPAAVTTTRPKSAAPQGTCSMIVVALLLLAGFAV